LKLRGRNICKGKANGKALVTIQNISFYGGIDPETGIITEKDHELEGKCVTGRVLIFPMGKGSTVGSYTLYRLKKSGKAPAAIINEKCETIVAVGCIISDIPCIDQIEISRIPSEAFLEVNADTGIIEIELP
jgi:predicted aconitase with swiveling domain